MSVPTSKFGGFMTESKSTTLPRLAPFPVGAKPSTNCKERVEDDLGPFDQSLDSGPRSRYQECGLRLPKFHIGRVTIAFWPAIDQGVRKLMSLKGRYFNIPPTFYGHNRPTPNLLTHIMR
ncbi:hypothetical protein TWF192_002589 [Orbilia oligospora]|uniref:Uncharacterized protein n=1 Tax=Orbilia oligospora TaxID=2813651 RepID=A0A6G1MDR6_ORBOL|nr:hypothetical protein TWF191_006669 [Orbilia oligospora]KAF3255227.1 hypothetical protein TWF192_002589 [Orbilia oligospora]